MAEFRIRGFADFVDLLTAPAAINRLETCQRFESFAKGGLAACFLILLCALDERFLFVLAFLLALGFLDTAPLPPQ